MQNQNKKDTVSLTNTPKQSSEVGFVFTKKDLITPVNKSVLAKMVKACEVLLLDKKYSNDGIIALKDANVSLGKYCVNQALNLYTNEQVTATDIAMRFKDSTLDNIVKENSLYPKLKLLINTEYETTNKVLKRMLISLAKSFNFDRNLDGEQIEEIVALMITDEHILNYISIDDFYVICKEIKTGKREVYQCLDVQVVMAQINDYLDRKIEKLISKIDSEHKLIKHDTQYERGAQRQAEKERSARKEEGFIRMRNVMEQVKNDLSNAGNIQGAENLANNINNINNNLTNKSE